MDSSTSTYHRKGGRMFFLEHNVVVLESPYSTEFGRESRKFARSENMENLVTF